MARILVLYASLGSGHISAANALAEAFNHCSDIEVQVEDALAHASPMLRETLTRLYKQLSERAPYLYRMLYESMDTENLEDSFDENLRLARLERPFFQNLEHLVLRNSFDAIVCVQQIPSRILQLLEQEGHLTQPHYVVVTDVIAHSTWINHGVRRYFIPSDLTADVLIQRGVDPSLLSVTGIPISLEIIEHKSKDAVRSRHNLPQDKPVVTLFGGGLHPERAASIVNKLLENFEGLLVVAAGRNERLLEVLPDDPNMLQLGMIDYVDDLVAASDLVITKAGGLIISEVTARGTPMIIIDPFPGQEEWNADAVAAAGAGIQLRLAEMVAPTVKSLLTNPRQLVFMQQQATSFGQPEAALTIAERIIHDMTSSSAPVLTASVAPQGYTN